MSTPPDLPHSGQHELDSIIDPAIERFARAIRSGAQTVEALRDRRNRLREQASEQDTAERLERADVENEATDVREDEYVATYAAARSTWETMRHPDVWRESAPEQRADAIVLATTWSDESTEAREARDDLRDRAADEYGPVIAQDVDDLIEATSDPSRGDSFAAQAESARQVEGQALDIEEQAVEIHDEAVAQSGEDNLTAQDADLVRDRAETIAGEAHMRADDLDAAAERVQDTQVIDTRDLSNRPPMDADTHAALNSVNATHSTTREESLEAARKNGGNNPIQALRNLFNRPNDRERGRDR